MGIDHLDIKFRLEKKFNLRIDNDEMWFAFKTVGTLYEFVWQKLQGIQPALPLEGWCLYEHVLALTLKLPGARNRFWQTFERMIPRQNRGDSWKELSELLGCPLPPLVERPTDSTLSFPKECETPYELANWLFKHHSDRFPVFREQQITAPPDGGTQWTRAEVWAGIQEFLIDTLGVEPEEVVPEARLVEDLGMA